MIATQSNAHVLLNNELKGPSPNLPESCRVDPLVNSTNKGQSVDSAAPLDPVREVIGRFRGLVKWDNNSSMPAEDGSTPQRMTISDSPRRHKNAGGQIDTAAPIASVRDAVNKFAHPDSPTYLERINSELEKLQEEVADQKKETEAAEESKEQVLTELESVSMLVRELELNLEKEESLKSQAQQDSAIAQRLLRETKLEISRSSIYARSWSKLNAARERVEAELSSAKRGLQAAETAHDATVAERRTAARKACEYGSESLAMEKTIEYLQLELDTTKESTELVRAAYDGAVQGKVAAASEFERQKSIWEMETARANVLLAELEAASLMMNDLRLRVESSSDSLCAARSELSSFVQGSGARQEELELELETAKRQIEKTKGDIDYLQGAVSPLRLAIEREKSAMAATREEEALKSATVLAIDGEIVSTEAEIEMVLRRENVAREKAEDDLPEVLDQAEEEADQDKSTAKSAGEEAEKAEAEAKLAKASATATEKWLDAAVKEIQAAKASAMMTRSGRAALKQSKHVRRGSKKGVAIPVEEYLYLRQKADEAEELARNRVSAAAEQVKEAKESETKVQQELEEVTRAIQERRRALVAEEYTEKKKARLEAMLKAMTDIIRSLSGPQPPPPPVKEEIRWNAWLI